MKLQHLVETVFAEISVKFLSALAGALFTAFGILHWGRGGRRRLVEDNKCLTADNQQFRDRLAALEARQDATHASPAQTINFSPAMSPRVEIHGEDIVRPPEVTEGVMGKQFAGHVEFGTTHGHISVSLAGGSATASDLVRWLHAKRLLAPLPLTPEGLDTTKERWLASPGAGRTAAQLTTTAQT